MTPQQKYNKTPRGRASVKAAQKRYAATEYGRRMHREYAKRHRKANPEKYMWLWARKRAKAAGVPFTIEVAEINIPPICPVLGEPLSLGNNKRHSFSPTLDRIIPSIGYVRGNVRVISHRANQLKNNATEIELLRIIAYMRGQL